VIQTENKTAGILLSKVEAASMLSVSLRMIDYLIRTGQLKSVKLKRRRLVPRSEILRIARGAK
jgi:excisionase family DNA binding protein